MAFDKDAFLTALDSMTVLELNDLVKAIEEKFGVSAAAMAAPAAGGGAAGAGAAAVGVHGAGDARADVEPSQLAGRAGGCPDGWAMTEIGRGQLPAVCTAKANAFADRKETSG